MLVEDRALVPSGARPTRSIGRRPDVWTSVLLAAVLLGGVLRFVGIQWGLPVRLHPDEWVIVDGAIDMANRNSFEPSFYYRPDHVEIKLSYLAYVAYSYLVHGVPAATAFASDPSPFVLISRAVTATFGTASIVVAYLVGRRFSRAAGALCAVAVAFFPPYVEHAHLATPDVPLTFAFLVLILVCTSYVERPAWGTLLLASLAVSMAIAIKYPGAIGAVMIALVVTVAAIRDRAGRRFVAHGAGAVVAVVGGLFLISPVLFTNLQAVRDALGNESRTNHLGADGLGWGGNLWFYLTDFTSSAGLLVVALAVVGAVSSLRSPHRTTALPLYLGVVFCVVLSAVPLHWSRWGLPMYLTPLLLAPIGLVAVVRRLRRLGRTPLLSRVGLPVLVGVSSLAALALVADSLATTARFVAGDTRVTAADELASLGVDATTAVSEGYTPLRPSSAGAVFSSFQEVDGELVAQGEATDKQFLVLSSDMFGRYQRDEKHAAEQRFYALVEEQFPRVATFRPVPDLPAGPLAVPRIVASVRSLVDIARGGSTGPELRVHEIRPGPG